MSEPTKQQTTFTLKCVTCGVIETRPASECHEQPFCKKCYGPMLLTGATVKRTKVKP